MSMTPQDRIRRSLDRVATVLIMTPPRTYAAVLCGVLFVFGLGWCAGRKMQRNDFLSTAELSFKMDADLATTEVAGWQREPCNVRDLNLLKGIARQVNVFDWFVTTFNATGERHFDDIAHRFNAIEADARRLDAICAQQRDDDRK